MITSIERGATAPPGEVTWFGLDPGDVAALGAGVIALIALIVSFYLLRVTREAAEAAKVSAQSEAAALQLAVAAAEREAAARFEAEGPRFEASGEFFVGQSDHAKVVMTMIGGPARAHLSIDLKPDAWCLGFVHGEQHWSHDHEFRDIAPFVPIQFGIGLMLERPDAATAVNVALGVAYTNRVDTTSSHISMLMYVEAVDAADESRSWHREVPVLLRRWQPSGT